MNLKRKNLLMAVMLGAFTVLLYFWAIRYVVEELASK